MVVLLLLLGFSVAFLIIERHLEENRTKIGRHYNWNWIRKCYKSGGTNEKGTCNKFYQEENTASAIFTFTIEVGRREVLIYINLHVQVKGSNNVFTYFLLEIGEKCTKYN